MKNHGPLYDLSSGKDHNRRKMVRIGVISDVHGNLPALRAVFAQLQDKGCELIVHLGDAIGIGPYPIECLDFLFSSDKVRMVVGNHERYLLTGLPESQPDWVVDHHEWVMEKLSPDLYKAIATLPYQVQHEFEDVLITFIHSVLRADRIDLEGIPHKPSVEELDDLFAPIQSDMVCFGHSHYSVHMKGRQCYLNPGSVGCNLEANARYAVIDLWKGKTEVALLEVEYDILQVVRELRRRKVPYRAFIQEVFFSSVLGDDPAVALSPR